MFGKRAAHLQQKYFILISNQDQTIPVLFMDRYEIEFKQKLNIVHHTALLFCSCEFKTPSVQSLFFDSINPSLHHIGEKYSLGLFLCILTQTDYPHNHQKLNTDNDTLYQNRSSCISHFALKMRNIVPSLSLESIEIKSCHQHFLSQSDKGNILCPNLFCNCTITIQILVFFSSSLLITVLGKRHH